MHGAGPEGTRVGGLSARALAERFGSPLYAYDLDLVRSRVESLRHAVPGRRVELFYSVKAHATVGILAFLRSLGVGADACSPGDLVVARAAGLGPDELTYTSVSLPDEECRQVVESGAFFVADSIDQIRRYAANGGSGPIGIRVLPGITAGSYPLIEAGRPGSKFGVAPDDAIAACDVASAAGLEITCLHAHAGSDLYEPRAHLALLALLLELAGRMPSVRVIDLGGGWATQFPGPEVGLRYPPPTPPTDVSLAGFGEPAADLLDAFARRHHRSLALRLEPGAFLLMDAGRLVARVTDVKAADPAIGRARPIAVLDTSYNHLFSAVVHDTHHELWADVPPERPLVSQDVAGNLMQGGDVLAVDRLLPALAPGDFVIFGRAGAYKASRASEFNGRPRPAEVVVDCGVATLVKRALAPAELLAADVGEQVRLSPESER